MPPPSAAPAKPIVVARNKTALTRYELSKPVKSLLKYGVQRSGMSSFDYGCRQGSDVKGLQGWDTRPSAGTRPSDRTHRSSRRT